MNSIAAQIDARESTLREILRDMHRVIVAYSGGVDSAVLLAAAKEELGSDVLAITGRSPSVAQGEIEAATALAEQIGAPHEIIETREFDNPLYRANPKNRCYYCKEELFSRLCGIARRRGYDHVVDGFNADDGRSSLDHRPGHEAGLRFGVRSPLAEAQLEKADIRAIAKRLGLSVWSKPATPCLSSRIPYGAAIGIDDLRKIDLAERYLRAIGYNVVRVRHFGNMARIEVPLHQVRQLTASYQRVQRALHAVGYNRVEIDPRGYRTGSLNA